MKFIVMPIRDLFEGYCFGYCRGQCQGDCGTACARDVR